MVNRGAILCVTPCNFFWASFLKSWKLWQCFNLMFEPQISRVNCLRLGNVQKWKENTIALFRRLWFSFTNYIKMKTIWPAVVFSLGYVPSVPLQSRDQIHRRFRANRIARTKVMAFVIMLWGYYSHENRRFSVVVSWWISYLPIILHPILIYLKCSSYRHCVVPPSFLR